MSIQGPFELDHALAQSCSKYSFSQLVELLLKLNDLDADDATWRTECHLLFKSNPSLGFATADVSALEHTASNKLELETTFIGLTGSQSPLPGYLLEDVCSEGELGLRKQFLDFFNHHLITLVYQIWRKYRYYIRFKPHADDLFSAQLFALAGLSDPNLRAKTQVNWCKMLAYAGVLAGRSRSPMVVSGIIAHCFDLENVEIRQWVSRKVAIATEQRMQLGRSNMLLGENTVIGDCVRECNGKFTVVLKQLSAQQYRDFLPTGKEFKPLCSLIEVVLREQMAYDLELHWQEQAASTLNLDSQQETPLGWSTFLGKADTQQRVNIQVRQ